jgi:hypothetical protein
MPAYLIPAALSLGSSLLGGLSNRSANRDARRAQRRYQSYLGQRYREGDLPESMQQTVLARTGAATGAAANRATSAVKGSLIRSGMEGSIAGARALADPETERVRMLGDTARDLAAENEMSRAKYADEMERSRLGFDTQMAGQRANDRMNLIGGIAGAGLQAFGGWQDEKLFQEYQGWMNEYNNALGSLNSGDDAAIFRAFESLLRGQPVSLPLGGRPMGTGDYPATLGQRRGA